MSPLAIALLAVGAILTALSFFIPDKDEKESKKDIEKQREDIRRLMESELDSMKLRVNEATNETVEYGMDKCERSLDKLANEKMMAVGEYASAVMEEIDKNHKEVLFLYDMLNDKQTDVKNTVRNAEAAVREITDATRNANEAVANVVNSASVVKADMEASIDEYSEKQEKVLREVQAAANDIRIGSQAAGLKSAMAHAGSVNSSDAPRHSYVNQSSSDLIPNKTGVVKSLFTGFDAPASDDGDSLISPVRALKLKEEPKVPKEDETDEFAELKKTTFRNVSNNNQQIIMLNKEGKSVIEIAKQLGLGVGEVQLVLDLFK